MEATEQSVLPKTNTEHSGWVVGIVKVTDILDKMVESTAVVLTLAFAVVMLVGVFCRYVLNNSLAWSDELALIIFAWAVFLSIATGYLHDKHVNLDVAIRNLPEKTYAKIHVLAEGIAGGYLMCLTLSGIEAMDMASRAYTDALRWPLTVPYMSIPVASVLMILFWARRMATQKSKRESAIITLIASAIFVSVFFVLGQSVRIEGSTRAVAIIVSLFGPMLIGVPVALCLGTMATFYVAIFGNIPFSTGAMQIFNGINVLALMAIPLLILSGRLMHAAGIAQLIVDFAQVLVGRLRGGLGAANVLASFLFGDISGSAVSDTAAIGSLMIPQMKKRGYRADFCAALQGTAGTLGMLAPLSVTVLLYATSVDTSISRLAAATILPAIMLAASFMLVTLWHARRYNYPREHVPTREFVPRTLKAVPGMFALVVVLGGIIGGVFTPAETGCVLLAYVLLLGIVLYRVVSPKTLYASVVEANYITGMTLFMAATSAFVAFMLATDLVSLKMVEFTAGISTNKYAVIFLVSTVFIILGMILEAPALIFGFLPSFVPLLVAAKIDMIHWGVLFAVNMGLGQIIPPVAMNLFIATELAGVRYTQAVKSTIPFIIIMFIDIVIMAVFPQIPLQIPHVLFGYPVN